MPGAAGELTASRRVTSSERDLGSRPVKGSSRINSSGSVTSAPARGHLTLLAAAEVVRDLVAEVLDAEPLEDGLAGPSDALAWPAEGAGCERDVIPHGGADDLVVDVLEHDSHALAHFAELLGWVDAEHGHLALDRGEQAEQVEDEGRLAAAVGAQHDYALAAAHGEVEAAQVHGGAVGIDVPEAPYLHYDVVGSGGAAGGRVARGEVAWRGSACCCDALRMLMGCGCGSGSLFRGTQDENLLAAMAAVSTAAQYASRA